MIGLAVYHPTALREQAELLEELLAAASTIAGNSALTYVQGLLASTDQFSRQQKLTAAALEQLKTDVRGGVFRTLQFDQLSRAQQARTREFVSLQVETGTSRAPHVHSGETVVNPYRLHLVLPRGTVRDVEDLKAALIRMVSALQSSYAFVHLGADHRDVLMELTNTPIFPWDHQFSLADRERQKRLARCQDDRARIGDVVCGAYWGNVFGERIIDRLGGKKRIFGEAPVAEIRELPGNRLYLQLLDGLPDAGSPEYEERRALLESFLSPVSVLSASRPEEGTSSTT